MAQWYIKEIGELTGQCLNAYLAGQSVLTTGSTQ